MRYRKQKPNLFRKLFQKVPNYQRYLPKTRFFDKMSITPEGIDSGENLAECARVSTLEVGTERFQEGRNVRHMAVKRPSRAARVIRREIYIYIYIYISLHW